MVKPKRIASIGRECVACGCCIKACPKSAIHVHLGMIARVDSEKCIGCGRCTKSCPASVITVLEREAP